MNKNMVIEYTIEGLFAFLSLLVVHTVITCCFNFIAQITGICGHCGVLKIFKYFHVAKFNTLYGYITVHCPLYKEFSIRETLLIWPKSIFKWLSFYGQISQNEIFF
jgi:hypothetical protein